MINWLVKKCVKNSEDIADLKVRQSYGIFSGIVGIICNIMLFIFKFTAGLITGAVSISADAFNNLSDAGSSVVTLIGFKLAGKPADTEHPFGHGRIEYLSGLIVSVAIIVMGVELFKSSVEKILHPQDMTFKIITVVILAGSIAVKMWMAFFYKKLGDKISSSAMKATATDSMSDCIVTTVVLISLFITTFTGINVDGLAGAVVSVFVFLAGVNAAKETLQPLLGQAPEPEFVSAIEKCILKDKHIIGIHDMIVHDYGPGRVFVSVHAEVPYDMDVMEAHDVIDIAEQRVASELNCEISIHMDPVVTEDDVVDELKNMTLEVVKEIDETLSIHDFRTTKGPYITNVIFDIVVPFGYKYSDEELKKMLSDKIREKKENCYAVVNIDKDYVNR